MIFKESYRVAVKKYFLKNKKGNKYLDKRALQKI